LRTASGRVLHADSQRSATYGELASDAVGMPVPADPKLKDPKDFKIIGQPLRRLDSQAKVDGSGKFGLDVHVPGMLTALIARSPYFGGKVARFDATQAKAMPNVVGVFEIAQGVAGQGLLVGLARPPDLAVAHRQRGRGAPVQRRSTQDV
jgi:isoquinoline 1-oxidoreductase beta subunit